MLKCRENRYTINITCSGLPALRRGIGKTTFLADQIQKAVAKFGSDKVLVSSFTRAGAREIASRGIPVERHMVGTLHAICRRALGAPKITESLVKEWNTAHKHFALSEQMASGGEPESGGATDADQIYQRIQILRARLWDERMWPPYVLPFWRAWTEFKKETDSLDFTDLIAHCLEYVDYPPGAPNVMVVDETQDMSALELALVRKWGAETDFFMLAGDDDQAIFSFKGATPDAFLDPPCPEGQKRILRQSHRVPRVIQAVSQQWIMRVERREPKAYTPRRDKDTGEIVEGAIQYCPSTYKDAAQLLSYAEPFIAAGKTVMFLGACGYHVDPIKYELRKQAIPYHNPNRTSRGDWNPLGKKAGTSTVDRLTAFLGPKTRGPRIAREVGFWTADELRLWTGMIRAQDVLVRGAKTIIEKLKGERPIPTRQLQAYFIPESLTRALECEPEWLRAHLTSTFASAADYPLRVVTTRGLDALRDEPKITLGTIHCSPPDEMVLTARGYKPIGELDTIWDSLAGFHESTNTLTWGRRGKHGYAFVMGRREYDGPLLTLTTSGSQTRVTPNHIVRVKFSKEFTEKWVVYLMRRGLWWRVGLCVSGRLPYVSGGVAGRLATEQADAGWILGVYETRREALMAESIVQAKYGIPGLTFESAKARALTSADLHEIHSVTAPFVTPRVGDIFRDFGLLIDAPLYARRAGKEFARLAYWFETAAANVISQYMQMPVARENFRPGEAPEGCVVQVSREAYHGDVCSLDVPPYHFYISGGAVVHNSVKGDEANVVVLIPDLSIAGMTEWTKTRTSRDPIIRQFYVGLTRASETLIVCRKFGYGVDLPIRAPDRSSEEI